MRNLRKTQREAEQPGNLTSTLDTFDIRAIDRSLFKLDIQRVAVFGHLIQQLDSLLIHSVVSTMLTNRPTGCDQRAARARPLARLTMTKTENEKTRSEEQSDESERVEICHRVFVLNKPSALRQMVQ